MDVAKVEGRMKLLTVSFAVEIVSYALLIFAANGTESSATPSMLVLACALSIMVASVLFYVTLGILAVSLGKSWIVWVGLTFITKPIGTIVAYFMMREQVKAALQLQTTHNVS